MNELYTLVDKCAQVEEGRRLPEEEDGINNDSDDDDEANSQKKKKNRKHNKRCKDKAVMTVEGSGMPSTGKKAKAEPPGKEVATCTDFREAAAAEKARKGDGPYCKIHRTKGHDLQECHQLEQLVKKQKAEYEKCDRERDQDGVGGKGRGGRGGCPGKVLQHQGNRLEAMRRRNVMTRAMRG